jgi:hypothetical protein
MTRAEMANVMTANHPSTGADLSATKWRTQRMNEVTAPERIGAELTIALDIIEHMDADESEFHELALVIWHGLKAVCIALDKRA